MAPSDILGLILLAAIGAAVYGFIILPLGFAILDFIIDGPDDGNYA